MDYKLHPTEIVEWDAIEILNNPPSPAASIQVAVAANIYAVYNEQLPIIIEDSFRIIDHGNTLLNCVCHTKTLLKFDFNEKPILDLVRMFDEAYLQSMALFNDKCFGSAFRGFQIKPDQSDPQVRFNKAYQLIEAARIRKLLA